MESILIDYLRRRGYDTSAPKPTTETFLQWVGQIMVERPNNRPAVEDRIDALLIGLELLTANALVMQQAITEMAKRVAPVSETTVPLPDDQK